jgi:uncharacterized membrane protein YhaH (DUF805 family)
MPSGWGGGIQHCFQKSGAKIAWGIGGGLVLPPLRAVASSVTVRFGNHLHPIDSEAMENPYAAPQGEIIHSSSSSAPLTWKQILFSFEGRIPRRQYWAGFGIQMLAVVALTAVFAGVIFNGRGVSDIGAFAVILGLPFLVFLIWVGLAVQVKRWHDRNKSGWWVLVGFIPYIGGIWQIIECGCLRGTEGENRFGSDLT